MPKIYKSVNPDAIVQCLKCRYSASAEAFGATGEDDDREEEINCPVCESFVLWIEP